eukprot:CAMPEP_0196707302 /NCGR_PEP_ID=MMETSP1090-20130531/63761_1 /TAXON_ID=37098 /ORGANISM="Isochrysis sp, Strain CCMP1244" /LENGTH=53 /DNA_ID=CAMNT_0042047273 /DNA_START=1 /DNA_END=158 /DNA_ORIENTATION=+
MRRHRDRRKQAAIKRAASLVHDMQLLEEGLGVRGARLDVWHFDNAPALGGGRP